MDTLAKLERRRLAGRPVTPRMSEIVNLRSERSRAEVERASGASGPTCSPRLLAASHSSRSDGRRFGNDGDGKASGMHGKRRSRVEGIARPDRNVAAIIRASRKERRAPLIELSRTRL